MLLATSRAARLAAGALGGGAVVALACASCLVPLVAAAGGMAVWFKGAGAMATAGAMGLAVGGLAWALRRRRERVPGGGCGPACNVEAGVAKSTAARAEARGGVRRSTLQDAPMACDLGVFTADERRAHLASFETSVVGRALSVEDLPNGYSFRYPADGALFLDLARWAVDERRCCPFFTFALEIEPLGGDLWLRLGGGDGVKSFLAQQLAGVSPEVVGPAMVARLHTLLATPLSRGS